MLFISDIVAQSTFTDLGDEKNTVIDGKIQDYWQ